MAVVAALDTHMEITAVMPAKAAYRRAGLDPTQGIASSVKAKRRLRPCLSIASPIMKLPMNRKMTGSAKGLNTSRAEPSPATTHRDGAKSAVAARGMASVIQRVSAMPTMAKRCRAGRGNPGKGIHQRTTKTTGARYQPTRLRMRSKRSSAGDRLALRASSWGGIDIGDGCPEDLSGRALKRAISRSPVNGVRRSSTRSRHRSR